MVAVCFCCRSHVQRCSCYYFIETRNWSKTLRNFPKISFLTCSVRLARGGKKNAGEKSKSFFENGMFMIFTSARNQAIFM